MEIPKPLIDQIKDGNVVLFLGAGASYGAKHPKGINPPNGYQLAQLISDKFLTDEFSDQSLQYVSELAISEYDLFSVQSYIYELFEPFSPNDHHLEIPRFVWKSIITTNYDLIIEKAYSQVDPVQSLAKFVKNGERVRDKVKSPKDLPFYKIHGCITDINDLNAPLILTADQYINHKKNRDRLYSRIESLAYEYAFLFVGFSFADPDIRKILLLLDELKDSRVRSYMVGPNIKDQEARLWENKKITAIKMTFSDFMDKLKVEIGEEKRKLALIRGDEFMVHKIFEKAIISTNELKPSETLLNSLNYDFQYVHKSLSEVNTDPKEFYKGYFENWDPILKNLDVRRGLTDIVLSEIFLNDDNIRENRFEFFLIKGYAGSGKSVLLKRVAWEASVLFDRICLFYNANSIIDILPISELCNYLKDRIYIFIDNIYDNQDHIIDFIELAKKDKLPITLIGAERVNVWNADCDELKKYSDNEYELRYLTDNEINNLLVKLEKYDSLGYLKDKSTEERIEALSYKAGRELLVALYESTMGKPFSEIVQDEYNSISNPVARSLYLTVSILHRLGTEARAGLISRVHSIPFSYFKQNLFKPLEFIVFDRWDYRINDYIYLTRHKQIAEIIYEVVLSEPQHRYDEYIRILSCLDVDFENDRIAFLSIMKAKNLMENFKDPEMVRTLYKVAKETNPLDAKLLQQEAIFEMNAPGGNFNKASELLTEALKLAPNDSVIQHSFAEMALTRAEKSTYKVEINKYLNEAEVVSKKLVAKSKDRPHPYHTLLKIHLFKLKMLIEDGDSPSFERLIKDTEKVLSFSKQTFPQQEFILEAESQFNKILNNKPEAIRLLEKAYELNKRSPFLCLRLVMLYNSNKDFPKAKSIMEDTLKLIPGDKDINFQYALNLIRTDGDKLVNIKHYLNRSFTKGDNRYQAQFWFARTLYLLNEISESNTIFKSLNKISIEPKLKSKPRAKVRNNGELVKYKGSINRIEYNFGFVTRDATADQIYFYRYESDYEEFWDDLKNGDRISFNLAFNYKGPVAINVKKEMIDN
ncbi:SIR2 family protein [Parapedobacter defluvii]|uniref:SIR2 family protein n=1 Tax=Parapedobacter defluvii TaxID=2045106 RepID=A0ABQ1M2L6_9SPHI|nr:SIR2 family protein [Parapedobacter defluvii]GGC33256.1 SIR2 family protein [Parapedobacter defluvii]